MILGHVRDKMPRVLLEILTAERSVSIEFTVDTAFDGFLALPLSTLDRLGATHISESPVSMADGREIKAMLSEITILWDGAERTVERIQSSCGDIDSETSCNK